MPAPRKRPSREADITIDDTGDEEILNAIAGINNIPTKSAKTTPVILSTTPTTTPQPKKRRTTTPDHSPPKLRFNSRTAASLLPRRSAPRAARYPPPSAADHSVYNNHSLFLDTSTVEPTPRVQPPPPPARSVRPPPTPTPIASASMYDLAKVDWTLCDPLARESNLFKFDYLLYGNPTYKQADSNNRFYPRGRRDLAPPEPKAREPSWARTADLRSLANNMNTHEEFFATCWVRDVIGDDAEELEVVGPWGEAVEMKVVEDSKKGIRKTEVSGIDMMLMGKEFPCRNVLLVGIVVEVDVSEEKGIISYRIDDSTGIIRCVCPLPKPGFKTVREARKPGSIPTTPVKIQPIRRNHDTLERMRRGALVRVVGKVTDGAFPGADFILSVEKIEALKDSNAETKHHLLVARLHREVYSQDFDLTTLLDRIRSAEREEEKDWKGSQMTASAAGSPTKQQKIKLRAPAQLDDDRLTLDNFTYYIHHHLLQHKTLSTSTSSSSFAESSTIWRPNLGNESFESTPIPFTVSELESTRSLHTFADILAQKLYREKKLGKGRVVVKNQSWSKVQKGGASVAHYGSRGGNAVLLPPPGAAKRKGKKKDGTANDTVDSVVVDEGVKAKGKEITPLTGEELRKAVGRVFVDAMRTMRKAGTIILTSTIDSTLERIDIDGSRSSSRDSSMYGIGSTSTSTSLGTNSSGYWPLDLETTTAGQTGGWNASTSTSTSLGTNSSRYWPLDLETSAEEKNTAMKYDDSRFARSSDVLSLPDEPRKKSAFGWPLDLAPTLPAPAQSTKKSTSGCWELDLGPEPPAQISGKKKGYWELDLELTPRAPTRSVDALPTIPDADSTQLFLPLSPRAKKSIPFVLPSSPNTTAITDTSLETNESWTKSMQEIDTESFELVTTTSLAPYLLRILKNESERSALSTKSTNHPSLTITMKNGKTGPTPTGCSEEVVRKRLANDERWEAVSKTDLVVSALEELSRRNLVRYAGKLWKYGSRY